MTKIKVAIVFVCGMAFATIAPVRSSSASVYSDIGRIATALEQIASELHQQNAHARKASNSDGRGNEQ